MIQLQWSVVNTSNKPPSVCVGDVTCCARSCSINTAFSCEAISTLVKSPQINIFPGRSSHDLIQQTFKLAPELRGLRWTINDNRIQSASFCIVLSGQHLEGEYFPDRLACLSPATITTPPRDPLRNTLSYGVNVVNELVLLR